MSSQPWQLGMSATGELVAIIRYSVDQCSCGHPWSDHYQPTRGGKAACWATPRRVLCDCHDFELATTRNASNSAKE